MRLQHSWVAVWERLGMIAEPLLCAGGPGQFLQVPALLGQHQIPTPPPGTSHCTGQVEQLESGVCVTLTIPAKAETARRTGRCTCMCHMSVCWYSSIAYVSKARDVRDSIACDRRSGGFSSSLARCAQRRWLAQGCNAVGSKLLRLTQEKLTVGIQQCYVQS